MEVTSLNEEGIRTEITPLAEEEIRQFRAETKGTAERIHFNNAGSSLPPDVVVETVIAYLKEEATHGGYEAEDKYKEQLENAYTLIARLINAEQEEIAIVESASVAWGLAFNGVAFESGDEIITSEMEYVTNVLGLLHAKKTWGVSIVVIPNDEQGNFSLSALEKAVSPRTRLIAVTHIPSTAGGMIPIVDIGKIARKHGILYLVDACQTVGQIPIDVREIGCDMLAATGRKFLRAPRGTGFLYVRKEIQDQLKLFLMDGYSIEWVSKDDYAMKNNARRFQLYENNRALTLGLAKAVEYALQIGVGRIWQRVQYLADLMRRELQAIDGITVHDIGDEKCGIVTFSLDGMESSLVKNRLAEKKINVSVGLAKSTLFYMSKNHLSSVVRASVHYYNTEEEITIICDALGSLE
jgi:cysteine desulfurase/selenocysteine lyase